MTTETTTKLPEWVVVGAEVTVIGRNRSYGGSVIPGVIAKVGKRDIVVHDKDGHEAERFNVNSYYSTHDEFRRYGQGFASHTYHLTNRGSELEKKTRRYNKVTTAVSRVKIASDRLPFYAPDYVKGNELTVEKVEELIKNAQDLIAALQEG